MAGLIRINAPLSLGQQLLPDIVSGFRAEHPQVSVSLSLTDRFIDIVSERFDLALRVSEAPRDRSTIWRKVCRVRRILVASPGYLAILEHLRRPMISVDMAVSPTTRRRSPRPGS